MKILVSVTTGMMLSLTLLTYNAFGSSHEGEDKLTQIKNLIEAGRSDEALKIYQQDPELYDKEIVAFLEVKAPVLDPFSLLVLAEKKFDVNQQEALQWYLIGQMRAKYDAARCLDKETIGLASLIMGNMAPRTAIYLFENPSAIVTSGKYALRWNEQHPQNNTPEYLCGKDSIPKEDWPEIHSRIRDSLIKAIEKAEAQEEVVQKLIKQKILVRRGQLNQPKYGRAFSLPNNKLLIIDTIDKQAHIYEKRTGQSHPLKVSFPWRASFTQLQDGRILMAGGESNGPDAYDLKKIYILDPIKETVNQAGELHFYRTRHASTLLKDGRVLLSGGETGKIQWVQAISRKGPKEKKIIAPFTDQAELFDPVRNSTQMVGSLNHPRKGHVAVLLRNGQVMILGGISPDNTPLKGKIDTQFIELYDPNTGSFKVVGKLSNRFTETSRPLVTLLQDGRVLVTGAPIDNSDGGSAELVDPTTGLIEVLSNTRVQWDDDAASIVLPDGRVFIFGPKNYEEPLSFAEIFDPKIKTFEPIFEIPTQYSSPMLSLTKDGKVLILGGGKAVLLFDPIAWDQSKDTQGSMGIQKK